MTHLSSAWQDSSVTLISRHQTTAGSTCSRTPVPLKEPFPSTLSLEQLIFTSPLLHSWTMRHKQSIRCVCAHTVHYCCRERGGRGGTVCSWDKKSRVEEMGRGQRQKNIKQLCFFTYCTCLSSFLSQCHCSLGVYILNFAYHLSYMLIEETYSPPLWCVCVWCVFCLCTCACVQVYMIAVDQPAYEARRLSSHATLYIQICDDILEDPMIESVSTSLVYIVCKV